MNAYVKIALGSCKPVAQVARDLDLSVSVLRNWINQAKIDAVADPNGPLTSEERAELARLRREHKQLEMENAFLKNHPGAGGRSLLDQKLPFV